MSRLGRQVRLLPMEAEIFELIFRRYPQRTSISQIWAAVYGAGEGPETTQAIRVHVHNLRKYLAAFGMELSTYSDLGRRLDDSGGYCLIIHDASQAASWPVIPRRRIHGKAWRASEANGTQGWQERQRGQEERE